MDNTTLILSQPTTIKTRLQDEDSDCDNPNDYELNLISNKEARLPQLVKQLQNLIQDDGTLPINYMPSQDHLSIFLRVRGYNVERSLAALKRVYKFMGRNKNYFQNIKPRSIAHAFDGLSTYCLKHSDASKCGIFVSHFDCWDPSQVPLLIALTVSSSWLQEILWTRIETQINGVHMIVDFNGLSWAHIKIMTPTEIKRCLNTIEDGLPIKIVGIHCINYPSIFWSLFYIGSRFMSKKLRKRIHFHERLESLHAHFSPTILPVQLGGALTKKEALDTVILESIMKRNQNFTHKYDDCIRAQDKIM